MVLALHRGRELARRESIVPRYGRHQIEARPADEAMRADCAIEANLDKHLASYFGESGSPLGRAEIAQFGPESMTEEL